MLSHARKTFKSQVYGNGKSEELLGEFVRKFGQQKDVQVATKV